MCSRSTAKSEVLQEEYQLVSSTSAVFSHGRGANVVRTAASAISTASPSVSTTSSALTSSIIATTSSLAIVQTLSASSSTPSSTTSPSKSNGRTRTIALAISIPIAVIAFLAASFLLYRYRKSRRGRASENAEVLELPSEKRGQTVTSELAAEQKHRHDPAELPANKKRSSAVELPGHEVGKGF
jgi:beta-lactamase regulating signal transducer with metallopeptidase domain